ncbi:hypothetical protein B0O80DRAFT_54905 [Mortierella sp. GBAus27b]|nr:hypothetical protein B0O80DRAFT_54905 [Mortierella sp. GBAus27b]
MPSEEDSDDETDVKRRSKFMSGAALELNKTDLRALSQLSIAESSQESDVHSLAESSDSGSKAAKKKMSLGKRISKFFSVGNSKSSETASSSSSTKSPASSIHGSDMMAPARNSTTSLAPIDELITPPGRVHGVYIHQRSHSTPDQIGNVNTAGNGHGTVTAQNAKLEDHRLRRARDSGFEEADGRGHRRHSSSIPVPQGPTQRSTSPLPQAHSPAGSVNSNRSSIYKSEGLYMEQHARRSTQGNGNVLLSTSSPQLRIPDTNHRLSFMSVEHAHPSPSPPSTPRRCSTPASVPETLISRVDREKASVCFQTPNARKETFTKDANLDPVLSNLVQQHRRDIIATQRLSCSGLPPQSQQHSPLMHQGGSPRLRTSLYMDDPMFVARDPHARRDSSGSQHLHFASGLHSPQARPSSPGFHATDAQLKRFSAASQQQQHQHPYFSAGQRMSFTGSHGNLPQYGSSSQSSQGQHSPLAGPQRTSPKRASSAGVFSSQLMQQPESLVSTQMLHVSPLPSPSLGAIPTATTSSSSLTATKVSPEMSLKQQKQQLEQLQQMRLQQQQLMLQQQQQQQQLQHQLHAQSGVGLGLAGVGVVPIQTQFPVAMTSVPSPLVLTPAYLQPQPTLVQMPTQQAVPMYAYRAPTTPVSGYQ